MTRSSAFITVALFGSLAVQAQSVTYRFTDGTSLTHGVTDVRSTDVDDSEMRVFLWDGTTYAWTLSSLLSYGFTAISTSLPVAQSDLTPVLVYPNPASGEVRIGITASRSARTEVDVLDLRGGIVRTLVDGQLVEGEQVLVWDGREGNGQLVADGTYFIRVTQGHRVATHRVILQ